MQCYLKYLLLLDLHTFLMLKSCLAFHVYPGTFGDKLLMSFSRRLDRGKILSPGPLTVSKAFVFELPSFLCSVEALYNPFTVYEFKHFFMVTYAHPGT